MIVHYNGFCSLPGVLHGLPVQPANREVPAHPCVDSSATHAWPLATMLRLLHNDSCTGIVCDSAVTQLAPGHTDRVPAVAPARWQVAAVTAAVTIELRRTYCTVLLLLKAVHAG
jgi:hypothetical protein